MYGVCWTGFGFVMTVLVTGIFHCVAQINFWSYCPYFLEKGVKSENIFV